MAFAWSDAYSVGDAELDAQHQRLVALLDGLATEVERGSEAPARAAEHLFEELALYVMTHFAYEEQRMAMAGYPLDRLAAHRRAHGALVRRVQEFQVQLANREAKLADLLPFLYGEWLLQHICSEDHDYKPYLAKPAA